MSQLELVKQPGYTNPELAEILQKNGLAQSLDATTDIYALRQTLLERKRALTAANTASGDNQVKETDHQVDARDGFKITARVYSRKDSNGTGPVMVMLHGGGWILGGLDNEALLCRKWCEEFCGVSINVDYRLAPEYKFPVPVYDCYDVVKWTAANADSVGGDLTKGFVIAGVSAGANMAATISHLYRDEKLQPPLTGVYLSIPSLLSPSVVPEKYQREYLSREENKDAPILNAGAIALFRKLYEDDPSSPLMSPVLFPSGHRNLPPTYFQVCGMDPLRDEGLIYERILREECRVDTRLDLYPGLPHGFWSWWPNANFSRKQQRECIDGLAWLLQKHS